MAADRRKRFPLPILATLVAGLLLPACLRGPAFMQQSGTLPQVQEAEKPDAAVEAPPEVVKVLVATVEDLKTGAATGLVKPAQDVTQVVPASANSKISGATAEFPPGTVAIDTEITVMPGDNLATTAVVTQLGVGDEVASAAAPVTVSSSVPMDTVQPFTVMIPLPDDSGSGLALADRFEKLVVLYRVNKAADGTDLTGVITRGRIEIKQGFARIATNFFGTFQAVITKELVKEAKELPSAQIAAAETPKQEEPPAEEPKAATKRYYVRGAAGASFGNDQARAGTYQGWVHGLWPGRVGATRRLQTGVVSKLQKSGD